MDLTGKLEIVNISDTGRKRPHNEDSTISDPRMGFAVLADGMGGYKAGEVASAIAVNTVLNHVRDGLKQIRRIGLVDEQTGLTTESLLLRDAVTEANDHIFRTANTESLCHGMGTTVVSVLFYDNRVSIAHVGDSRLYRLRNGVFEQVTLDHSLVQELVNRGFFTKEEALVNTPKNLVTRALGIEEQVEVDVQEELALPGDIYLMCTDGLNDMISDEEIHLTLSKYSANLVQAARELIRIANANGGKDNISVVLVRPLASFPAGAGWWSRLTGWFS